MNSSLTSKIVIGLCLLCLFAGIISIDNYEPYIKDSKTKKSKVIGSNINKIAVMELEGEITTSYESGFFVKETNAATLLRSLMLAYDDDNIKGVIIRINCPGGTVAMSQNIYNQILKIREKKPVIAVLDDVAASGGYYIASAADRIIAQDGTLTGSIGVIMSFFDIHTFLKEKLLVDSVVIKSGKFKDMGSMTREITTEEKELMQGLIDDSYQQFVNAIIKGRIQRKDNYSVAKTNLEEEILRENADGRIFTGRQAQQIGLVDSIGDLDSAEEQITKMAQEKHNNNFGVDLIQYAQKNIFSDYFVNLSEYGAKSNLSIEKMIPTSVKYSKRPLYLWE